MSCLQVCAVVLQHEPDAAWLVHSGDSSEYSHPEVGLSHGRLQVDRELWWRRTWLGPGSSSSNLQRGWH